jgi:hypothetical protein
VRWRRNAKRRVDRITPGVWFKANRRLTVNDNDTRAWQAWKMTCYTVLIIALVITVVHVVFGG